MAINRAAGPIIGVVLVLLISGCMGVLGPVTETSTPEGSPTPSSAPQDNGSDTRPDYSAEPWATETGINASMLVETHRGQLANADSFTINETVWLNESISGLSDGGNNTGYFSAQWDFESPRAMVDQGSSQTYITGETTYLRYTADEQGEYEANSEQKDQSEFRSLARRTALTSLGEFGGPGVPVVKRLTAINWTYQETLTRNGTTLYRLTGSKQDESVNMSAELLVDTSGVIHRFRQQQVDKERLTASGIAIQVWDVNSTTVTPPDWIDETG